MVRVLIARSGRAKDFPLPEYATPASAGVDLRASDGCVIPPGGRALVPTGLRIALPEDYEAQIRPRSGLALRHGVTLPNSPGTIDADYRGEIGVILMNLGQEPFVAGGSHRPDGRRARYPGGVERGGGARCHRAGGGGLRQHRKVRVFFRREGQKGA